ncbi:UNVERIFIED_ORG: L-threonine O-3-phosphate decarboxylase [Anoxybacillus amylolyticus]|uniref:threonine-phosphate decarboxylase CobD n=1 Tax=Geobacillus TaxID=129337 RepID=UPI0009BD78EA|nr:MULTISPECIES: threonine-phosphate decarboxylase CobD [Geobacillus]MCG6795046.1 threonine-phosphate decarboxylase [Geobacillus sp. YHL]OQP13476.1 threonine-phosphate decarboxylase [Geobacillus thermoleovorans]QNU21382.1 threonine-phosphate decarboxylase [Geobacillus thermoleovorans]WMJ18910.1 threonine-phosphate decarboxylase CobD [Geobacillus kaustophilus]
MRWPAHGANPLALYEQCGLAPPNEYIDFSVNTNPYRLPPSAWPNGEEWIRWAGEYPDSEAKALRELVAKQEQIRPGQVLVTNGAAEAIYLLAALLAGRRVGILEPTFSEYRRACLAYGCEVKSLLAEESRGFSYDIDQAAAWAAECDAVFFCHPNNPTGTVMPERDLRSLVAAADQAGTYIVVDEAFYPFWRGGFTAMRWLDRYPRLIVLRSLTKIHHLAGVRLGYVAADEAVIASLKTHQPPWSTNCIAQQLALRFMAMESFVKWTKERIAAERERVFRSLPAGRYAVSPSVVNFYLLRPLSGRTEDLFFYLLQQGIVPRHTMNFPGLDGRYVRLAVKTQVENDRLLEALARWSG